jgi:hypothetical protein
MVVQSVTELQKLQNRIETEASVVVPIFVDQHSHPAINTISSLHILIDKDYYCVPFNHPDAIPMSISLERAFKVITLYKREILHTFNIPQERVHDVATILHLSSKVIPEIREYYTPIITRMLQQFQFKNLHLSVPLMMWVEYGYKLTQFLKESFYNKIPDGYDFVNNKVIPTLTTIEKSGIYVDSAVLMEHYGDVKKYINNNTIYSEYNPYTSTGRPSNKYGGINFAAINKNDGTRRAFTSRYGDDGLLIQFDYEAFHLRLVGAQINYNLPTSSVHTYLAQQYYGKQEVTPDEYEQSKARTFALMYGMNEDFGGVEFFHNVRKYSEQLWDFYKVMGFIKTNSGKRIVVDEPSPNKVFNYSVQWLETEEALSKVSMVCQLLEGKLTKPILYTYDALLLDLHRSETAMLPRIKSLLEEGGYPTRMYKGRNYDELEMIKI